jgi:mannose-6-phosphate isomerase-like protein (cupin superfamily)
LGEWDVLVGVILGQWHTGLGRAEEMTMMEELPRTVENPLSGERVTFLATAEETGGEYVRIRNETSAGAQGVVMHYHLGYTEAFEVLEGALDVCVGGKENHLVLAEGDSVFVPPNTAHRFWNSSTALVIFEVEIRPARNFEKSIRAQFGMVQDGKTTDKAIPKNILELALIYELSESYIAGMPLSLQKGIFGVLARVARLLGYDPEFSRYTRPDGLAEARTPPSGRSPRTVAALTAMLGLSLLVWRRSRRSKKN